MPSGQALLEFLVVLMLCLVGLIAGGGRLIHAQWNRFLCGYSAFEQTRAELEGSPQKTSPFLYRVKIQETATSVRGTAHCGGTQESVELLKLEARSWN